MNDQLTIRRANPSDVPTLVDCHIITWKAAFKPILTAEQFSLKNLDPISQCHTWQQRLDAEENQSRYTFVAAINNQLVGYTSGVQNSDESPGFTSTLHQLYVLPEIQRRGIGRQLVQALVKQLINVGYRSMLVWVMIQNPAARFYRDVLGGVYITERIIPDADGILKEAAYGWKDLTQLIGQSDSRIE